MRPIILVGAGGNARACIDVIERHGGYTVAGLVGLPAQVGEVTMGYRVVGCDRDLEFLRKEFPCALVAIGQIRDPGPRVRAFGELERLKFEFPVVVSPSAYVSPHATVGAGTIVMHGAVINACAVIGVNCIVNSQALVEHDAVVGDHCHISTGAVVNGGVRIGHRTFIGSGARIREARVVGDDCVIGMGKNVLDNCPSATIIG